MSVVNEHKTAKIEYVTLTQKSIDYQDDILAGKTAEVFFSRSGKAYLTAKMEGGKEVGAEITTFPAKKDFKKKDKKKDDKKGEEKKEKVSKVMGTLTLEDDGTFVYTSKNGETVTLK